MNMLDGTCFTSPEDYPCYEDYMPPKEKIASIDANSSHWTRLFSDIQKREKRLQEMARELQDAGWFVEAPKGRV